MGLLQFAYLFQFVHIVKNSARDANDKHRQVPPGPVLHTPGHVNDNIFMKFNFFIVEPHSPLPFKHVVNLVCALMEVQFGIGDLEVVDLAGCAILFFEQRPDLPAGLSPGFHIEHITS